MITPHRFALLSETVEAKPFYQLIEETTIL
jgi:hypothetical protein